MLRPGSHASETSSRSALNSTGSSTRRSPVGYQSLDAEGRFIIVNEAWCDVLGYDRDEVVGRWFGDFLAPEYVDAFRERFPLFKERGRIHSEFEMVRKDGARRFVAFDGRIGLDPEGRFQQTHCVLQDITEARQAREALERSERRYDDLFQCMLEAFAYCLMEWDEDGRPTDWTYLKANRAFSQLTGLADPIGKRVSEVLPDLAKTNPEIFDVFSRVARSGKAETFDSHVIPIGRVLHIAVASPEPGYFSAVFEDVTDVVTAREQVERLNAELEERVEARTAELEEVNAELQRATRAKSEFLASMSHELRTPLNSIIGFTAIVRDGLAGPVNEEQARQLGMVYDSSQHLLQLINQVLRLSAVEAGRAAVDVAEFSLADLAHEETEQLRPLIGAKKLELTCEAEPGSCVVRTDRTKVAQILMNLIGNALKFTEQGSVRVAVRHEAGEVAVVVSDTGSGIAASDVPKVFDEFYRAGSGAGAGETGTGLGLSVSRRLADLLGGVIQVDSELGVGSTFTLRVPQDPPTVAESAA